MIYKIRLFFISQDVVFHENIFPFHSQIAQSTIIDPFPELVLPQPLHDSTIPPYNPHTEPNTNPAHPAPANPPNLRRSNRNHRPPSYLQQYHCNQVITTSCTYPISDFLNYDKLSPSYRHFVMQLPSVFEPQFYHQAAKLPEWQEAMKAELQAMEANNTWTLIPLPPNKHTIGCRWVYKVKYHPDGSVDRCKARLVAKGYTQQAGLDFIETFSPVAKLPTIRVLLTLAAVKQWNLLQLDMNNAFLNGELFEEIYMDLPLSYPSKGEKLVCRINKSIYGLR